ncbi:MAG: thermonuclease family protein [Myxococcota bacterium]|nr:thermonuclease family protein [Myxococcota bacterium]
MKTRTLLILSSLLLWACDDASNPPKVDTDNQTELEELDASMPDQEQSDDFIPPDELEEEELIIEGPRELVNGTPVRIGHIIDGDTLDVFVGIAAFKTYTIRLQGLAAPECRKEQVLTEFYGRRYQCVADDEIWGLGAWQGLVAFAAGKEGYLTCDDAAPGEWCPMDTYDRYLAYISIDGRDLATEMAFQGNALSYTSFTSSKRADICRAEYNAQDANRGMWKLGNVTTVINQMHDSTQNWYYKHHDRRCDEAMYP